MTVAELRRGRTSKAPLIMALERAAVPVVVDAKWQVVAVGGAVEDDGGGRRTEGRCEADPELKAVGYPCLQGRGQAGPGVLLPVWET